MGYVSYFYEVKSFEDIRDVFQFMHDSDFDIHFGGFSHVKKAVFVFFGGDNMDEEQIEDFFRSHPQNSSGIWNDEDNHPWTFPDYEVMKHQVDLPHQIGIARYLFPDLTGSAFQTKLVEFDRLCSEFHQSIPKTANQVPKKEISVTTVPLGSITSITGLSIYLTGEVPNYTKEEISLLVIKHGGIWKVLNKSTKLLVIGESPGEKRIQMAEGLNIPMMRYQDFFALLGEPLTPHK